MAKAGISTDMKPKQSPSAVSGPDVEQFLAEQMEEFLRIEGRTKRSAVRLAIVKAIQDGIFSPGDHLPPEKKLSSILGVAVGTVQAALQQLQSSDTIVRRRGDGSRVASIEPLSSAMWHFRFLSKTTGQPVRFSKQEVEIDLIEKTGDWSEYLHNAAMFIRISRRMTMSDGVKTYAEMYLNADLVPGLLNLDPEELDMVNIRPFLEERFGLFVAGAKHTIRTKGLSKNRVDRYGLMRGSVFFEIHAKAFSQEAQPVYFQRIFADSSRFMLDF